jgi:catechol 2,3-dioxygenase-like lactoylglutathione lyase family enzyme
MTLTSTGIEHLVHTCVVCSDFDRSFDFYTRICGATPVADAMELDVGPALSDFLDFEGDSRCKVVFLKWKDDSTYLELQQYYDPGSHVPRTTKDVGLARIALRVRDVDEALAWIRHNGVAVAGAAEITLPNGLQRKAFSIRDPDGLLVELIEYLEHSGRSGGETSQLQQR